jgi:predicted nucleotidyltransferase
MNLAPDEQAWLEAYRRALKEQHPEAVGRMVIYGSKARGTSHPDSDLDVLLVLRNDAASLKRELRNIGYLLSATSEAVPSIMAYTEEEWESRQRSGSPFWEAVERDAVEVL